MNDLMVSASLLINLEKCLLTAEAVVKNLDEKLLEQNDKIQSLESELKKRDELLREAKAIICFCDNSFFTDNLDFIEKVEAILEGK